MSKITVFCPECGNKNEYSLEKKKGFCVQCGKEINLSVMSNNQRDTLVQKPKSASTKIDSADTFANITKMTAGITDMLKNPGSFDMSGIMEMTRGFADSGIMGEDASKQIENLSQLSKNFDKMMNFGTPAMTEQALADLESQMDKTIETDKETNTTPKNIETKIRSVDENINNKETNADAQVVNYKKTRNVEVD